jgi:uncharacterized membrane protein YvlD (DUF360 family)
MGSRFFYIPLTILMMNFFVVIMNTANILENKPIISFDYSDGIVFAFLGVAVVLEFVYLFVDRMVLE